MFIIGIAGGTGSGKTTIVNKIIEQLPINEVAVLSQDAYYRDNSDIPLHERQQINFDHPDSIEFDLLIDHLNQLKNGLIIQQPVYSYLTCTRQPETIPTYPTEVVIVEGILIFTHPELRKLFDIKVFVFTEDDERLIRVIKRDILERGRNIETVLKRYNETIKPMHQQFIEPSQRFANLIIPEGGQNTAGIDVLFKYINMKRIRN